MDLVLSSEKNLVENLNVDEPFGTSDHYVIRFEVIMSSVNDTTDKTYFDYYKADYDQIRAAAEELDFSCDITESSVEDDWLAFKTKLQNIRDQYIPKRKSKVRNARWVDRNVIRCRRAKNKAWQRYKQEPSRC